MDRRAAAERPARGGGGIPAPRTTRARITLAALSALAYAGVFAYATVHEPSVAKLVGTIAGIGALLHALLLWRAADELLPWSLGCLAAAYAIALVAHGSAVDDAAPLVAAGLLLAGELAAWSIDERWRIAVERTVVVARATALAGLTLAGLLAAGLVISLSAAPTGGGLAWTGLGAAAAVLVLAVGARATRR